MEKSSFNPSKLLWMPSKSWKSLKNSLRLWYLAFNGINYYFSSFSKGNCHFSRKGFFGEVFLNFLKHKLRQWDCKFNIICLFLVTWWSRFLSIKWMLIIQWFIKLKKSSLQKMQHIRINTPLEKKSET